MRLHESVWVFLRPYGSLCVFIVSFRFLGVVMGPFGFL